MWDEMCAVWKRYRCAKPNHGTRVILWDHLHTVSLATEITYQQNSSFIFHCPKKGPYYRDWVPTGTFLAFWVPIYI